MKPATVNDTAKSSLDLSLEETADETVVGAAVAHFTLIVVGSNWRVGSQQHSSVRPVFVSASTLRAAGAAASLHLACRSSKLQSC